VLFFENQTLEPAAQRDFASRFGKLHFHPVYRHVEGVPEITLIETRADSTPDNDNWHTDVTFIATPPFGAVLTPKVLPPSGGDTLWSSTVAAYNGLSEPIRRLVDGLTAEHDFQHGFRRYLWGVGDRREAWERAVAANPPVIHPVVRTLEDGRRGLFVNEGFTSRIIELKPKESEALLAFLFAHLAKPEFTVRWRWKLGDVAFWDNRLSTHYATLDYLPHSRTMTRAAILGDRPRRRHEKRSTRYELALNMRRVVQPEAGRIGFTPMCIAIVGGGATGALAAVHVARRVGGDQAGHRCD
jgi:taurine dioxygenase